MATDLSPSHAEQLFEFRYRPNARILDCRGDWASTLSSEMALPKWEIVDNRLDILDESKSQRGFVSFRNAGFIVQDASSRSFHSDRAQKFLRKVYHLPGFASPPIVERLGVRFRCAIPTSLSFEALQERFATRYGKLTDAATAAIGNDAVLLDVGYHLNFRDAVGHFNTMCGPMAKAQLSEFLPDRDDLPDVSLFYDIDYWQRPQAEMTADKVSTWIANSSNSAWARLQRIAVLMLEA